MAHASNELRALQSPGTITVYQAYAAAIADPAVEAQKFVPPFRLGRMTWIKPSFLWMMYRSGWASKEGQERILAIEIQKEGFEWALRHGCLSHFDAHVHADVDAWRRDLQAAPVRVQWDPARDLNLQPLSERTIQIGLSGEAVDRYVDEWTVSIRCVNPLVDQVRRWVMDGEHGQARQLLPEESLYVMANGN